MGNPILSDDAVGVRLARAAARRLSGVPGVSVIDECTVGGLDVLAVLAGFDRLIVLDSIRSAGGLPGAWYRFTAEALRDTIHLSNIHDANFATTLALGRRMGIPLPPDREIHIFAVEIEDNMTFRDQMTDALERSYPEYSEEILLELDGILGRR